MRVIRNKKFKEGEFSKEFMVSVVIPTFNTGGFLEESFGSLLCQSIGFENIEVVFVDDSSSDGFTRELISSFVYEYSNCFAVFLDENSGFPGLPRNIGLEMASGEFIMFMDHDDSYKEDALKILYDKITENNADIAISNFNQVFKEGSVPFKSIFKDKDEIILGDISENPDLLTIPAAIWTRLFRKSFLEKNNIKFLESMLGEDVYFASKTSLLANGIIYLNSYYGYDYKIRDNDQDKSTIHIRNKKYIEAILNGFYKISEMIKEESYDKYANIIFRPHLDSWLYTIILSNTNDEEKRYLLKKASNLYKENYVPDPYFKGRYEKLVKYLINDNDLNNLDNVLSMDNESYYDNLDNYDLAILEIHKLKCTEKNMNKELLDNIKLNNLKNKIAKKSKNILKRIFQK